MGQAYKTLFISCLGNALGKHSTAAIIYLCIQSNYKDCKIILMTKVTIQGIWITVLEYSTLKYCEIRFSRSLLKYLYDKYTSSLFQ